MYGIPDLTTPRLSVYFDPEKGDFRPHILRKWDEKIGILVLSSFLRYDLTDNSP